MPMFINTSISCGVKQFCELQNSDTAANALALAKHVYAITTNKICGTGIVIFSDAVTDGKGNPYDNRGGERLAKFLSEKELGKIIESDVVTNPNSTNGIKVWIFQPDHDVFRTWMEDKINASAPKINPPTLKYKSVLSRY